VTFTEGSRTEVRRPEPRNLTQAIATERAGVEAVDCCRGLRKSAVGIEMTGACANSVGCVMSRDRELLIILIGVYGIGYLVIEVKT